MKKMRIAAVTLSVILSLASMLFAEEEGGFINPFVSPPAVELRAPLGNTIDLTGKNFVEFKWWNDRWMIRTFIFRIYKGYATYAPDLIYKKVLSADAASIEVETSLFEAGQVYTWSLVQVANDGQKSDASFESFKAIRSDARSVGTKKEDR